MNVVDFGIFVKVIEKENDMLDEIEIGCATTNSKYKKRLDCALVKIPESSALSGVFTTNNFKSAPVKNCIKKFKKKTERK